MSEVRGAEHWIAAEFERNIVGAIEDFQDPSKEWSRLFCARPLPTAVPPSEAVHVEDPAV